MVVWDKGITIPLSLFEDASKAVHLLVSVNIAKEELKKGKAERDSHLMPKSRLSEEERKKLEKAEEKFNKKLKEMVNVERAVMRVLVRTVRNIIWPGYTGRTLCALPKGCSRPPFHNDRIKVGGG